MRAVVVAAMLALTILSGCAEVPGETETDETPMEPIHDADDGEVTAVALPGQFIATFENTTYPAGAFNVSLDYLNDADVNLTHMSWTVSFTHIGNASEAPAAAPAQSSNATHNGTADGNATEATNVTVVQPVGNVTTYEGVGLPAMFEANLTELGNFSVSGMTIFNGSEAQLEGTVIEIVSGEPAFVDPCLGAPVQESMTKSGTLLPGVLGTGFYNGVTFDVLPCQTSVKIVLSVTGVADTMIEFAAPNGDTASVDSGFVGDSETYTYAPGGYMEAGTYRSDVYSYATVADQYQLSYTFGV